MYARQRYVRLVIFVTAAKSPEICVYASSRNFKLVIVATAAKSPEIYV